LCPDDNKYYHSVDILFIPITPKIPYLQLTYMQLDNIISIVPVLLPYPPRFSVKCLSPCSTRRASREISSFVIEIFLMLGWIFYAAQNGSVALVLIYAHAIQTICVSNSGTEEINLCASSV